MAAASVRELEAAGLPKRAIKFENFSGIPVSGDAGSTAVESPSSDEVSQWT